MGGGLQGGDDSLDHQMLEGAAQPPHYESGGNEDGAVPIYGSTGTAGSKMAHKGHLFMEKLRQQSQKKNANPLYNEDKIAAKICMHSFFEPISLLVIVFNSLWIGYSVDQEDPEGKKPPRSHMLAENFFCLFFGVEILIRILAYKRPKSFIYDPAMRQWNIFDFILVVFLLGETWALPMMAGAGKEPEIPALSTMRLLRLLRVVRVLRMIPELAMMVRSLVAAIRSVSTTFVLAVGIMYIFSIILTQWARTHVQIHACSPPENCVEQAFGSIAKSFLTLMQIICFDASFALIRAILKERAIYGMLLLLFILIVAFTVLNMLIDVVCQIVAQTSAAERYSSMQTTVESLLRLLEIEQTGFISRKELERNAHILEELDKVGVDMEVLRTSLSILDRKNSSQPAEDKTGHLDLEELLEVIFKLLHPPQTQDILLVQSKLEKLEKALSASGMSQTAASDAMMKGNQKLVDEPDEQYEMDERTRVSVEKSLWELESQVSSMLDHALEATGRSQKPPPGTGWDV